MKIHFQIGSRSGSHNIALPFMLFAQTLYNYDNITNREVHLAPLWRRKPHNLCFFPVSPFRALSRRSESAVDHAESGGLHPYLSLSPSLPPQAIQSLSHQCGGQTMVFMRRSPFSLESSLEWCPKTASFAFSRAQNFSKYVRIHCTRSIPFCLPPQLVTEACPENSASTYSASVSQSLK